jgi:methionyl-tRNA formyltransferase
LGGDKEGGTTIQVMAKEMDAGPILAQEKITIDPRETYQSLHDRLAEISAPLLEKVLLSQPEPKPQSEDGITICKKLDRPDGVCNSETMTAEEIDRKVRGLNPWPGVTMDVQGVNLKILETDISVQPKAISVTCKEGTLYLISVQEAGKKAMSGEEWARGRK